MKLLLIIALIILSSINYACIGSNNIENNLSQQNLITINNAGTIPLFKDYPTSSEIYVHNYASETIHNIQYLALTNTDGQFKSAPTFLDKESLKQCSSIAPGQSCKIKFSMPPLINTDQASAVVTLSYKKQDQLISFSQTFTFKTIINNTQADFASGVNISSFGHNIAYGTIYVYGKAQNSLTLKSNKYAIRVANKSSFQLDTQEQNNWVQAIEVTSLSTKQFISAELSLLANNHTLTSTTVTSSAVANGGILIASQIPVINTTDTINPSGSLILSNAGNAAITLSSFSSTSGITNLAGCTSGEILAIGGTCTLTFNVNQSDGKGNITVTYTGGSSSNITQTVNWYNSQNGVILAMNYSSPIALSIASPTTTQVTITNLGGYNLSNITLNTPQALNGAHANGTISYPTVNSCQGITLNVESSCNFNITVSDSVIETNQQIFFGISATYTNSTSQTYSRYGLLNYSVTANTFLYVSNSHEDTLSAYIANPDTGSLTQMSNSPVSSGVEPIGSVVSLNNKYLYVSNSTSNSLWAYSIDQTTGLLTHFASYTIAGLPNSPVMTPNGKFIYVGTWTSDKIYAFSINSSTGALTQVGTYTTGQMETIVIDSTSSYLYGASTNEKIYAFKINQSNGQLTSNGTIAAGHYPQDLAISPDDRFLYADNIYDKTINAYGINQSNGTLSSIGTYSVSMQPWTIFITPNNKFVYVTTENTAVIGYAINQTTGALSLIGSFSTSGGLSYGMAITSDSKYAYVGVNSGLYAIIAYGIDSTSGALSQIGIYNAGYTSYPFIDAVNGYLYTANGGGYDISGYAMESDGTLIRVPGSPFVAGASPSYISFAYTSP